MSLKETMKEYTLIKSLTELCLTVFCLYFTIPLHVFVCTLYNYIVSASVCGCSTGDVTNE